jgi:hypothetical protein
MNAHVKITAMTEARRDEIYADSSKATPDEIAFLESKTEEAAKSAPRYWRDQLSPEALADETPERMREIIGLIARNLDIGRHREVMLIKGAHICDGHRKNLFANHVKMAEVMERVASLSAIDFNDFEQRENLLKIIRENLQEIVTIGCPEMCWLDMPPGWKEVASDA